MPRKWKSSIILLLAVWLPASELAAVDVHSVQQRYARHKDFQASFTQQSFQVLVNKEITFNGSLYYKRPDRARMDVTSPQRQIITLKGSSVTVTLPDEGTQAIQEVPREIASQNILAFIAGLGSIERDYSVQESSDHLVLTPKNGTGAINIWIDGDNLVRRVALTDAMGNRSDIRLSGYRFDVGLKDDLFNPPTLNARP
ncbi:MAG TPA: outer membrane lipoprotein carrier protein LolA [Deltaproteobacteria bacterium]|nr:outer membrane lipoprotein carrier protein LolA [Deltaproteobacteria bacterium]